MPAGDVLTDCCEEKPAMSARWRVPSSDGALSANDIRPRVPSEPLSTVKGMRGYIEVAGLRTWHEVSGEGDPLVLLHGGFLGASSFYAQTAALVDAGFQ